MQQVNQPKIGMKLSKHQSELEIISSVICLYVGGLTTTNVAKTLSIGRYKVENILHKNNIKIRGIKKDLDNEKIKNLYNYGKSFLEISKIFNVSPTVISRCLIETNTTIRSNFENKRQYSCNSNYFSNIDTERKAYWLGFLYADGNNYKGRLQIRLQDSDKILLEEFSKDINSNSVIKNIKVNITNRKNQVGLFINDIKLTEDLIKLGCVPNKSLILKFPTEEQVPKHLLNHFIRGYFDGDGCISINKKGGKHFSITSNNLFIEKLQEILIKNCNLNKVKIVNSKQHKETTLTLSYGGNIQVKRIFDYLYKDATIYLERKFIKFLIEPIKKEKKLCNKCEETHYIKGLCKNHYNEHRRNIRNGK